MRSYFRTIWYCWFATRLSFIMWACFLLPSLKWLIDGDKQSAIIYAIFAFFAVPAVVLLSIRSEKLVNKEK